MHAAANGACFGMPNIAEIQLAEILTSRVPWAEQVRFANSGTEAVMTAIRLARAYTGRSKIIVQRPSYHGMADVVMPAVDEKHLRGVPKGVREDVVVVTALDIESMREAVNSHRNDLAAVVIDLMPTRAGLIPAGENFVKEIRKLTQEVGALLICDEVIAYRAAPSGLAHSRYGLEPDLLVLGKIIGGGFPVGAILGKEQIMDLFDPANHDGIDHGGTFTGNPVTMRAGLEAMRLFDEEAAERLNGLGRRFRNLLLSALEPLGWDVTGYGSLARFQPSEPAAGDWAKELWWESYSNGVLIMPKTAVVCLSTAFDEKLVDASVEKLVAAVKAVEERNL
jgi:glutamate-1-semialdehyde 2,1-aminomutase